MIRQTILPFKLDLTKDLVTSQARHGLHGLMTLPSVRPSQMASYVEVTSKIIGDGSHGALIIWQDFRSGSNNDIYGQRI